MEQQLVEQAVAGDRDAVESLLGGVQDAVFNLAPRMLGIVPDSGRGGFPCRHPEVFPHHEDL